jgi:ankyrin repeat protein
MLAAALVAALLAAAAWMLVRASAQNRRNDALWEAVDRGDLSAVTSLLDQGADPNTNEYQVLDARHRSGVAAILTRLRGREPRYNQDPRTNQWTADPRVGGNWTSRQKWNTVLWLATDKERPEIARALIAAGAQDKATGYLSTALMWAAERGHTDLVRSLLDQGSDVNATNDFGDTALDGAAALGHIEIARLLLQHGADINRGNSLAHARANGHPAMVELIEQTRAARQKGNARHRPVPR